MPIPIDRLKWFFSFFNYSIKQYKWQAFLLIISGVIQLGFEIILPFATQLIFDNAIVNKDIDFLLFLIGILVVAFLLYALAGLVQDYISSFIGSEIIRDVRLKMFDRIQNLGMKFFTRTESGVILSHFAQDLSDIERVIVINLPMSIYYALLFIISAIFLYAIEWRIALATWIVLPIGSIGSHLFGEKANQSNYNKKKDESKVLSIVQETINAQAVIRTLGIQEFINEQFARQSKILLSTSLRSNFVSFLLGRFSLINIVFLQLFILGIGAYFTIKEGMTLGSLVGFISFLFNINVAADGLSKQVPNLIGASAGLLRLEELFLHYPSDVNNYGDISLPIPRQTICFNEVSFSYSEELILNRINLTIVVGSSVAIVGSSGSGKSTILNLLNHLYEPTKGTITIDELNLAKVTQSSLNSAIGMVFQDAFLFNTTIQENIRLGNLNASNVEIETAARLSEVHDVIQKFPQGYETIVGDRGGQLSGGQRQRIALARAILHNPKILLLDEATSALDPETEAAINETINRLAKDRTLITVTHRLMSIINSDRIFVLDRGNLIEQGSHQELIKLKGLYYRLWNKQICKG
jgi:ATP-binding cassette, subfamily B, bacterial